jgi:hypothetical protein
MSNQEDLVKPADMPSFPRPAQDGSLQTLFLNRLARLIKARNEFHDDLNVVGLEMLDRAIYATYRDCIDYGAADEARALVGGRQPRLLPAAEDPEAGA